MSEIVEISEILHDKTLLRYGNAGGWRVKTKDAEYIVAIDTDQDCCEDAGYFNSADDPRKFVGAELLAVERVMDDDGEITKRTIPGQKYGLDEGSAIFVNFITDRGPFQLAVYNAHNGDYGHEAVVVHKFAESFNL